MSTISELLEDLDSLKFDTDKAFVLLFSKAVVNQAILQGLREFTITKLSGLLDIPYENLQKEFLEFSEPYLKTSVTDFRTKFGLTKDSPKP
ncbi:MAG TPA: hypothetical protein DCE80_08675 [Ignavibacteriales bacterium]|nr:hypothetical protein [Ignavibacteriales bacterium]